MKLRVFVASFFVITVVFATPVELICWTIGDDKGKDARSFAEISNIVDEVNLIYRQVAMSFVIRSITQTNDTYFTEVLKDDYFKTTQLLGFESGKPCLELYFVPSTGRKTTAFHSCDGIVISSRANARSVAHEIGHACGLPDIYDSGSNTTGRIFLTGMPSKSNMPDDWGWYPPTLTHADVVGKLLMFGKNRSGKADISYGDIYGITYTNKYIYRKGRREKVRDYYFEMVPVGFGRHGERSPRSL